MRDLEKGEAKIDYALARHSPGGAEWANNEPVYKAQAALQTLLGRIAG